MRNSFIVLALCSVLAFVGCGKRMEMPSRYVLDKVLTESKDAETISLDSLCVMKGLVETIFIPRRFGLDIRNAAEIAALDSIPNGNKFSVYDLYVTNDSTVNVMEFNPNVDGKINPDSDVKTLHDRQYTFHKNGDVEIKLGNYISEEYDSTNGSVVKHAYIDGKTGLVVYSVDYEVAEKLDYRITNIGEIEIGEEYGDYEDSAQYLFDLMKNDIHRAMVAYSKGIR